jgi:hypothetical protein
MNIAILFLMLFLFVAVGYYIARRKKDVGEGAWYELTKRDEHRKD